MSSLAFVACTMPVIAVIIASKGYKRFMYRLMAYFMTVDLLTSIAELFEAASVSYSSDRGTPSIRDGWGGACVAFAFMDQLLMWMSNCVIAWIVLYLMLLVHRLYHLNHHNNNNQPSRNSQNSFAVWWKYKETIGLILVIAVPFTFNWVPFIWDMYGLSGLFCWIKEVSSTGDCSARQLSTILMFSMCYGPLLFLIICGFLCFVAFTVALCIGSHLTHATQEAKERFKIARKEIAFILAFPLLYYSLFSVAVVDRLYSLKHDNSAPFYPLWIAHVIATPSRLLVSPIAFLCHPFVWKTLLCHKTRTDTFIVPSEQDATSPLIIRGCPTDNATQFQGLLPS